MSNYNEFDDPPRGAGFLGNVGPKAAFFIVLIALSFLIGVVWRLYVGGDAQMGQEIPIVRADDAPFKVAPDDPGGMDIPHKDSTIFSSLNNEGEGRIENLLADADDEEPMPRSQLFAGLNTEEPEVLEEAVDDNVPQPLRSKIDEMASGALDSPEEIEEVVEEVIEETSQSIEPPAPEPEIVEPTPMPTPALDSAPELELEPEKVEPVTPSETVLAPKPVVKAKPQPTGGDYYVQLGSVKSADGAESEWNKIVAKYPSILSGYSHRVETADLGEKGTFYRIQAGPVSKDKAVTACEEIKKINPNGCLLKKK